MFIEFVPGNFERKRAVKKMAESTYDSNGRNFTFFSDQNFANQEEWEEKKDNKIWFQNFNFFLFLFKMQIQPIFYTDLIFEY